MDNVLNNLQSLISEEETSKELSVEEKIAKLDPEPSLIQVATVLLSQSSNAELEAKKVTKQLARNLVETVQTVKTHHADIEVLKTDMDKAKLSPIPTLHIPSVPLPPIKSATFPSRNPPPTRFRFQSSTGWGAAGSSSTSTSPFIFGASAAPRQSVKDLNKIFSEQLGYMDHISQVMARTPTN
jgi:hypothetical protein